MSVKGSLKVPYGVEYAKSGRSHCSNCRQTIPNKAIRIIDYGAHIDDYSGIARKLHLGCFKRKHGEVVTPEMVDGFADLRESDKKLVMDHLEDPDSQKKPLPEKVRGYKPNVVPVIHASDLKGGSLVEEFTTEEELEIERAKNKRKSAGILKKADKRTRKMAAELDHLEKVVHTIPEDDTKKLGELERDLEESFSHLTNDELREMLRVNGQLVKGNTAELIERNIDGFLHGRLPRCPKCSMGKLEILERKKPAHFIYKCNGYWDEEAGLRQFCDFVSNEQTNKTLERGEWLHIGQYEPVEGKPRPTRKRLPLHRKLQLRKDVEDVIKDPATPFEVAAAQLLDACRQAKLSLPSDNADAIVALELKMTTDWETGERHPDDAFELLIKDYPRVGSMPPLHHSDFKINEKIASMLEELAHYEKLARVDKWGFRVRKNHAAANAIRSLPFEITSGQALGGRKATNKVAGIGQRTADKIDEFLKTGKITLLEDLKKVVKNRAIQAEAEA